MPSTAATERYRMEAIIRVMRQFNMAQYFAQRQLKQYIESREDIRTDITIAALEFRLALKMAQRLIPERCHEQRRNTEPLVDFTYSNIVESELVLA